MNHKMLQTLRLLYNNINKTMSKNQHRFLNSLDKDKTQRLSQEIQKKVKNISQQWSAIKQFIQPTPLTNFNFMASKQPNNEDSTLKKKDRESKSKPFSKGVPRQQSVPNETGAFFKNTFDSVKKAAQQKYDSLSKDANQYKQTLMSQSKEKLDQLAREVSKQKEDLAKASQQKMRGVSAELKEKINSNLTDIKDKKDIFIDNLQSSFRSKKEEGSQKTKSQTKSTPDSHFSFLKKKINKLEEMLHKQKKADHLGSSNYEKLAKKSEELAKTVKDKVTQTANLKAQIVGKLISKLFWRVALLIGVGAFAYGMGTSLPKEIREHINLQKKESKDSKPSESQ